MGPFSYPVEVDHRQDRLRREADAHRLAIRARDREHRPMMRGSRLPSLTAAAITIVVLVAVRGLPTG